MSENLKLRTKAFSLSVINLVDKMDYSISKKAIMSQLVRIGTSLGANYRAATRGRSDREFYSKLRIVLEEVDECCFWLEIIDEKAWLNVKSELKEANELTSIFVTIIKKLNYKK